MDKIKYRIGWRTAVYLIGLFSKIIMRKSVCHPFTFSCTISKWLAWVVLYKTRWIQLHHFYMFFKYALKIMSQSFTETYLQVLRCLRYFNRKAIHMFFHIERLNIHLNLDFISLIFTGFNILILLCDTA